MLYNKNVYKHREHWKCPRAETKSIEKANHCDKDQLDINRSPSIFDLFSERAKYERERESERWTETETE